MRNLYLNLIISWVTLASFALFAGCGEGDSPTDNTNHSPVISDLVSSMSTVDATDSCTITCSASDTDGDALTYNWSTNAGLISGTGSSITWTSPDVSGSVMVVCEVSDVHGAATSDSIAIVVTRIIPTDGLISHYLFEGNADDESGNGNHGIIHGSSVTFVASPFSQAIQFDNSSSTIYTVNDYVELPKITTNELSISHWVRFINGSSTHYSGCTYSVGRFNSRFFRTDISNSALIRGQIVLNGTYYNTSQVDISDHEWHFIAVTISNDYLKLYHNGSIIDSTGLGFDINFSDDFHQIALHRFLDGISSRFTGEVDNLRVYGRSLTASEVARLFEE